MVYAKSKVTFSRSAAQDRMVAQMFIFFVPAFVIHKAKENNRGAQYAFFWRPFTL